MPTFARFVASVVILSAAALPAAAQQTDLFRVGNVNWTGVYVGATAATTHGTVLDANNIDALRARPHGSSAALQIGANWQFDNRLVVGAEVYVPVASYTSTVAARQPLQITYSGKVNWMIQANARIGYAIDRFLPYVTAGYVIGQGELRVNGISPTAVIDPAASFTVQRNHFGWNIGAGVEVAITERISARLQYMNTRISTQIYSPPFPALGSTLGLRLDTWSVGVNYRF